MPQDPGHACLILPYSHACHKIIDVHASYFHTHMHATRSWTCMLHTLILSCVPQDPGYASLILSCRPHTSSNVCLMHTGMHAMGRNSDQPCLTLAVKHTAKSRFMYASFVHNPKRIKFFIYLLSSGSNSSYTQDLNFPVPMYIIFCKLSNKMVSSQISEPKFLNFSRLHRVDSLREINSVVEFDSGEGVREQNQFQL